MATMVAVSQCQRVFPWHFGQVTNPLFVLQIGHTPVTTQKMLRVSPVPLHSWQTTCPFPPQRAQFAVSLAGFDNSIMPPLMVGQTRMMLPESFPASHRSLAQILRQSLPCQSEQVWERLACTDRATTRGIASHQGMPRRYRSSVGSIHQGIYQGS